jgi:hypothetical protein
MVRLLSNDTRALGNGIVAYSGIIISKFKYLFGIENFINRCQSMPTVASFRGSRFIRKGGEL